MHLCSEQMCSEICLGSRPQILARMDQEDTIESISSELFVDLKEASETEKLVSGSLPSSNDSGTQKRLHRQFFLFAFSILCSISSYSGLINLQSSINISDALGNRSLTLMSVSTIACCLFVTPIMVQAFGAKTTILVSQCCFVVYILANFHPATYTLLPGGVFLGIAEALVYTPALMFCTCYGRRLAKMKFVNSKDEINKFVGYFWGIFQMNEIFSNAISTAVLGIGKLMAQDHPRNDNKTSTVTHTGLSIQSNISKNLYVNDTLQVLNRTNITITGHLSGMHNSTMGDYLLSAISNANSEMSTAYETTMSVPVSKDFTMCGANDCYDESEYELTMENYVPIASTAFYVMIGVYASLALVAIPIMATIPELPRRQKENGVENAKCKKSKGIQISMYCRIMMRSLMKLARQFIDPQQLLLTPLTLYHGLYTSFISSEITRGYVSCILGVEQVGLAMLAGGIVNVIVSFLFGYVAGRRIFRNIFLIGAIFIDMLLYSFCLLWRPTENTAYFTYIICILFGLTDGVWSPFIDGKYAKYFAHNEEVAYSVNNVWEWIGFALTYGWTMALCMREKIYIQMCILLIGVIGCAGAEFMHRKKQNLNSSN